MVNNFWLEIIDFTESILKTEASRIAQLEALLVVFRGQFASGAPAPDDLISTVRRERKRAQKALCKREAK